MGHRWSTAIKAKILLVSEGGRPIRVLLWREGGPGQNGIGYGEQHETIRDVGSRVILVSVPGVLRAER